MEQGDGKSAMSSGQKETGKSYLSIGFGDRIIKTKILLEQLLQQARQEEGPNVDVADEVLRRLTVKRGQLEMNLYRPLMWISAAASAAAACVAVGAYLYFEKSTADSMTGFYETISWVVQ